MGEKTQTYLDNTGQNHYNYFAKMVFVCAPCNFAGAKERNDLNMANMKKEYKMSAERKEELQKELTYLKTVREKEVADSARMALLSSKEVSSLQRNRASAHTILCSGRKKGSGAFLFVQSPV